MGAASFAANSWVKPVLDKTPVVPTVDGKTQYYLYNKEAKGFMVAGNNWGTRACVAKEDSVALGYKITLTQVTTAGYEDYVVIKDSCEAGNKGWKEVFVQGSLADESIYMDRANQDVVGTYWKLEGDVNAYKLVNALNGSWTRADGENQPNLLGLAAGKPTTEAGGSGGSMSTGAYTLTSLGEEATDWIFISAESAEKFLADTKAYEAFDAFMKKAEEYTAAGFDCSAYVAKVPAQSAATIDDVKAAEVEMVSAYATAKASAANPIDMTSSILNASFEENMANWKALDGTTLYKAQSNKVFTALVGGIYAEFYHENAKFSAVQTLKDMPAGVYELSAAAQSPNKTAELLINDTKAPVDADAARYKVVAVVKEAGDLTIGITASDDGNNWNCVDDFQLVYYGQGGDAWTKLLPDFAGKQVSSQVLAAYNAKLDALNAAKGADIEAAYAAAQAEVAGVQANADAWDQYQASIEDAEKLTKNPDYSSAAGDLAEYLQYDKISPAEGKTTEEVLAEIQLLDKMKEEVLSNTPEGTDMSNLLVNADFANGWTGWTHKAVAGGNVAVNAAAKCAEGWNNADFDIYQEIKDAPVGVYSIQVQGFYRYSRDANAWKAYFNEATGEVLDTKSESPVFVYLNDNKTPLANVFDYKVVAGDLYQTTGGLAPYTDPLGEYWYPNDMTDAGRAFDQGAYAVSAFGLVAQKGDALRIGVKGNTTQAGDSWGIFTRFKLVYEGYKAEIIKPQYEKAVADLAASGKIGSEVKTKVDAVKAKTAGVDTSNGKAMFNVLAEIYALNSEMESSAKVFTELNSKFEELSGALELYQASASEMAMANAAVLAGDMEAAISGNDATTAAAQELIGKVASVVSALKVPGGVASDDSPIDYTVMVENPGYAESNGNGWTIATGSGAVGYIAGAAEFYMKTYDMYQDIIGLPAGKYEVGLQGFYRMGSTADSKVAFEEGKTTLATMYAKAGDKAAVEQPMMHLFKDAQSEALGVGGEVQLPTAEEIAKMEEEEGATVEPLFVPYTMAAAVAYFANDLYKQSMIVEVAEGETLRIGVKQTESMDMGWMIFSNWTLVGYGPNSTKEPTDVAGVEEVKASVLNGKFVKGGNIVIVKDGKMYNVAGMQQK